MGLVNGAKTIYSMITGGGMAAVGNGIAAIGTKLGITSLEGFGMGLQGVGTEAGSTALSMGMPGAQAGQMAGAAASWAGGVAGGIYGGRAISGGYGVGGSGNGIVNAGTALGALFAGPLGALIGGLAGGVVNRVFGRKAPEIESQGIRGTLSEAAVTGESYQNIVEKGGWLRSSKRYTNTQGLTTDFQNSLLSGYTNIKAITEEFGKTLGVNADALKGYTKAFDLKLDPKDATKSAETITKFFTDVGNELATKLIPSISEFSKVGESASTTLERLANDYKATDTIAQLLGKTSEQAFGAVGLASVKAREQLINLSGGLDKLSASMTSYAQNYLTEAEKAAPVLKALDAAFAQLNIKAPTTRQEFKNLVSSLDLTKDEDIKLFNSLMDLQDAFAQVHEEIVDTTVAVKTQAQVLAERKDLLAQLDNLMPQDQQLAKQRAALDASNRILFDEIQARTKLKEAYDQQSQALQNVIDRTAAFAKDLRSFYNNMVLGDKSPLTPEQRYQEAKAQYQNTYAKALAGDETAQADYQQVAEAFLAASQISNSSSARYLEDFALVRNSTAEALTWAEKEVDAQTKSLGVLRQQVQGLLDVKTEVGTVASLIREIGGYMLASGGSAANGGASGVTALYYQLLGRSPDAGGLKFWTDALKGGATMEQITTDIKKSDEYKSLISAPMTQVAQAMQQNAEYQSGQGTQLVTYATQEARAAEETASLMRTLSDTNALLLEELRKLRKDAAEQTEAQIEANFAANAAAANSIAAATTEAAKQAAFEKRVTPV
jgi:hypothetical protein